MADSKEKITKPETDKNINDNYRRKDGVFICCLITFLIIFIFISIIFAYLYYSLKNEKNSQKNINCLKEFCNIGYHLINDECILDYTFKAIYNSDGSNIQLINYNSSQILEMTVDGKKVNPSNNYSFNDEQNHEVSMLLDMPKNLSSTFKGIANMISISFNPLLNTSNIIDMGSMFYNCSSIKSIDFSKFDTSKVTKMIYMFYNCYSLISINLYNFNTSKVTDMNSMFFNCSLLTSIDLSNFDTSKVTDMNSMFFNCSLLTSIVYLILILHKYLIWAICLGVALH